MSFVRRKFNAMLGVATISMAVNFIVMLSGSVIAGNLLGMNGLAAINVCAPAFAVTSFLGSLISVGAGLVFSRALGDFSERRAARVWSQSAALALGIGMLVFLAMAFGGELFMDLNGVTGQIRAEALSYWRWHAVSMGLTPLELVLMALVYADGDNTVTLAAGGAYMLGSFGFSVPFTLLTGHADGISGGAAATIVLVLAVCSLHFLRDHNHLRFVSGFSWKDLRRVLEGSAPDSAIYLCWGLLVIVINRLTVSIAGEESLAVVAIGTSLIQFTIVFDGVGEALVPLGGMYAGEKNGPALGALAAHSAMVASCEGVLAGIVMYLFAPEIASVYGFRGASAALLPEAVNVIRTLAFAMPFMGFLMMANTHYLVIGHIGLAVSVTVLKDFLLTCLAVLLFGFCFGFHGIWIGVAVGYAAVTACLFAFVRLRYGRERFPWLVGGSGTDAVFSIRLGREQLVAVRDRIECFLVAHGTDERIIRRVMFTVEENGLLALEHNRARPPCVEYFVSLEKPGFVRLIIRDDGAVTPTLFGGFSKNRYLNTLNCNRTEHWFKL